MNQEIPDGSVYVVHGGRLHLVGVWDDRSAMHLDRGIEQGPDDGVFHTFRPDGRIRIEADLAVPGMGDPEHDDPANTEPMEASEYHGA